MSTSIHCELCSLEITTDKRIPSKAKKKLFSHWITRHSSGSSAEALHQQKKLRWRSSVTIDAACDGCGDRFQFKAGLAWHCAAEHGVGPLRPATPNTRLFCDLCGPAFLLRIDLHRHHLRQHLGRVVSYHQSERAKSKDPFLCDLCGQAFPKRVDLQLHHLRQHLGRSIPRGKMKLSCDDCAQVLPSRDVLFRHWLSFHSSKTRAEFRRALVQSFRCDGCDQHFTYKLAMMRHKCALRQGPHTVVVRVG